MSVIVNNSKDNSFKAYVKGSPEKIQELSTPDSLPLDYEQIMKMYTQCGYRVLALGYKNLNINNE
jgi:cation-transporting ATPase 13A3/4/5